MQNYTPIENTRGVRLFVVVFFLLGTFFVSASNVSAAGVVKSKVAAVKLSTKPAPVLTFKAQELLRSSKQLVMDAGATTEFAITMKNIGTATWTNEGKKQLAVYTWAPKNRASDFSDLSWISSGQPITMVEESVKPGQTATFRFLLFAPIEDGKYSEPFQLVAGDTSAVLGGQFTIDIDVRVRTTKTMSNGTVRSIAPGYRAEMLLVSDHQLQLAAGATKQIKIGFKNTGKTSWIKSGITPTTLRATDQQFLFRDASWTNDVVTSLPSDEIKPGQLALFSFTVAAPTSSGGSFMPKFTLMAGEGMIDGGEVEIPIDVQLGNRPAQIDQLYDSEFARSGPRGPNITIGLFATRDQVRLAAAGAYALLDANDTPVQELSGVTTVDFDFATNIYTVRNGSFVWTAPAHVSFKPNDPTATIFEIPSYENRPTWDPSVNFNRFRGTITVHYIKKTDRLWVKETLPTEDYMRGLGETSNGSAYEFQKALVTAARTYALFVVSVGGKHKSEYFDLNATGSDQVYKGYTSELVRPNVVRAVEETRGTVVTYGGEMVVTPYFSNADGRTRSWSEVWHGDRPWLVTKPTPYDVGMTLWGHGVGMSAHDAVGRANAGATWQDILQYYYSGIALKTLY